MRKLELVRYVLLILTLTVHCKANDKNSTQLLSRRKRYVVFPKGSSLQLVFCYTFFIEKSPIFKYGITAGLAWMLPDDPNVFYKDKGQRFRRSIYKKLESYMDSTNLNGEQCVLKALCESGQKTTSKKSFIHEILHRVFSIPKDDNHMDFYHKAHKSLDVDCSREYKCSFSLFST